MTVRIIAAGFFILLTACAPVRPEGSLWVTGGMISGSSGSYREMISGRESAPVFDRPLAVTPVVAKIGSGDLRGQCNMARKLFDLDKKYASEQLAEHGVTVSRDGPLFLMFEIDSISMLTNLGEDELANYCMVIFTMELIGTGTQSVAWKPDESFDGVISFKKWQYTYRLRPGKIISALEDSVHQFIHEIAPTVRGEVEDSCGYFDSAPEFMCRSLYHVRIHQYDEYRGCAENKDEAQEVEKAIREERPELMERLDAMGDVPLSERGDRDPDSDACKFTRKWFFDADQS
ncbi:MAG: hypothetical protein ACLFWF_10385 [Alphaproteobacteria bacterium]